MFHIDKLGQPIVLTTSVLSSDTMKLSWEQPSFNLRGRLLRYHFQFSSLPKILLHNVTTSNEQYTTKLTCDNSHTISVISLLCDVFSKGEKERSNMFGIYLKKVCKYIIYNM